MKSVFRMYCFVAAAAATSVSFAGTITLTPTDDCYIRTGAGEADSPHDGSPVVIASSAKRTGLFQFDLSSVPGTITGATLRLSAAEDSDSLEADGYLLSPTTDFVKMDETTMTRDLFVSDYVASEIGPRALGTFSISGSVNGTYYDSTAADASDLTVLNAIRTETLADDRHAIIEVYPTGGGIDVNSKEAGSSLAPQLVVDYVPEPSALLLCGLAISALGLVGCRRKST
jgi:PEP-CTERM motif